MEKLKSVGIACEYHVLPCTTHASIASSFNKCDAHKLYFAFVLSRVAQLKSRSTAGGGGGGGGGAASGVGVTTIGISLSDVDVKVDTAVPATGKKDS